MLDGNKRRPMRLSVSGMRLKRLQSNRKKLLTKLSVLNTRPRRLQKRARHGRR